MKKQNLFLPLLFLLTSCFNESKYEPILKKRWGFHINSMTTDVYHFHKIDSNNKEVIDFYAFSEKFSDARLEGYILKDKDSIFSKRVQTLVQDIPYDKTTILQTHKFDESIFKFDISSKDYKYCFMNKDNKDKTKNNTGIRSYSLDDYDQFYDHLFLYIVQDLDMVYVIDIDGGTNYEKD